MEDKELSDLANEWKVNTPELLKLLIEDNPKGTVLIRPVQIFQKLLIELTERALEINDPELNKILQKMCLIEEDK